MDIVRHYSELLAQHGDDPKAVQLADRVTQRRRFAVLHDALGDRRRDGVLDVGCGLAHLHEHLVEEGWDGEYSGIDITPDFITLCRNKFPSSRFEVWDISAGPAPWQADWCLLNGVFNNPRPDPWGFLTASLRHMLASCRTGIAFNLMSTYVDRLDPDLVYFDPEAVFRFCKEELSPLVNLRHDYCVRPGVVPFEAAFTVLRSGIAVRRRLDGGAR
jgi:SAM-dependent methyltransferase